MKILAFDTTGEIESIAILDAGKIIDISQIEKRSSAAELLIPAIDQIMQKNNLEFEGLSAIVTAKGPASFTSVRIGLAAAKGLVLACNKPLLTYDSLLAKAYGFRDFTGRITVVIDAKMDEFFVASFISGGEKLAVDEESRLVSKTELLNLKLVNDQLVVGTGASFLMRIAAEKNIKIEIEDENSNLLLADDLALMAFDDLLNESGNSVSDSSPNYARDPKIGKRKV